MAREKFQEGLRELNTDLVSLSAIVRESIENASKALKNGDLELARRNRKVDNELNDRVREIERHCIDLLVLQQPVARDLRQISSTMKIASYLGKIGQKAADISKFTVKVMKSQFPESMTFVYIPQMADICAKMVQDSIDALILSDADKARELIALDDIVDQHFRDLRKKLIRILRESVQCDIGSSEPAAETELIEDVELEDGRIPDVEQAVNLVLIGKDFERIADEACAVAYWVIYAVTGEQIVSLNGDESE